MRGCCEDLIGQIFCVLCIFRLIIRNREFVDVEPFGKSGLFAVLLHVFPLHRKIAHMVENRVKHDVHPAFMGGINQFFERLLVAKCGVDSKIVDRIVLVIGRCGKNRAQVQSVYTQILQIVEVIKNSLQITAEKVRRRRIGTPPRKSSVRIVSLVAICEPFRENLIPNGFFDPFGRFDAVDFMKIRHPETG